jgi:hypothetical protein
LYHRSLFQKARNRPVRISPPKHRDGGNEDDLFIGGIFELMNERYSRVLSKLVLRGMVDNAKKGFFRRTGTRRRSSFKDSCGNRNRKRCVGS